MRASIAVAFALNLLSSSFVAAAPTQDVHKPKKGHPLKRDQPYPFDQVVVFGDNLSDNGNGSWAHGMVTYGANPQPSIYGYRTWTDGPVAASYLVDLLGVPMTSNYAVGHAQGGSLFGATMNNTYTNSTAGAPDAFEQIANYTSSGVSASDISNSMHFLWIGSNDITEKHIYIWSELAWINDKWVDAMATQTAELVQRLIDAGSNTVFVPNLYPRDISPAISFMCTDANGMNASYVEVLNYTINLANLAIQAALVPFGSKAIYYDVNSFMHNIMNHRNKYGITHAGTPDGFYEFCDGYSQADWDLCVTDGQGDTFYWMQYLDMTSYVHKLIAQDMANTIQQHFNGLSV